MADVFTKEQRSTVMRQVKGSRNKSTELRLIDFFKVNIIKGWRRNYKLFGKPDFTFPTLRKVVFGTDTIVETQNRKTIKNIGPRKLREIKSVIKKLQEL